MGGTPKVRVFVFGGPFSRTIKKRIGVDFQEMVNIKFGNAGNSKS